MAASKRFDRNILNRLEDELDESLSRRELIREVHDAHFVPLGAAWDYAERLADERGLSY